MAANEQSEHRTCPDTAGANCRCCLQIMSAPKEKPPNSSEHTAESSSRASQMDMEQRARVQAEAAYQPFTAEAEQAW